MADRLTRVCVTCQLQYEVEKQGIYVVEMAAFGAYKIWCADLHRCPKCGHRIIAGFADHRISEHYEPEFKELLQQVMESGNAYILKEKDD